jgi:predicted glycosyltransferase
MIWIYGDPTVFDPVRQYGFSPELAARVRYSGYFDQRLRLRWTAEAVNPLPMLGLPPGKLVLCMLGGGQDGQQLAEAFASCRLPPDANGLLLAGPYLPQDARRRLHKLAAGRRRFRVLDFLGEPGLLLQHADRVIAMGGYNTVSEVLSFEKPALLVPRIAPRCEQLIRTERLRAMGLIDMLHPSKLTPAAISAWLARDVGPYRSAHEQLDFDGIGRLPRLFDELIAAPV